MKLALLLAAMSVVGIYAVQAETTRPLVAGDSARIPGHVLSVLPSATTRLSSAAAQRQPLTLTVVLKRDDVAGFDRQTHDIYDPSSPAYRRFLTLDEMADRFGPSRRTYDRLAGFFAARGFELVRPTRDRLTLTVRASREVVERTLHLHIADYERGDRVFHANDRDPALPRALAVHVQSITGLSNFATVKPADSAIRFVWYATECALLLAPIRPPFGYKLCVEGGVNPYKVCITAARAAAEAHADLNFDFLQYSALYQYSRIVRTIDDCPEGTSPQSLTLSSAVPGRKPAAAGRAAVSGVGQKIGIIALDSFARSDIADYLTLTGFPAANIDKLSQVHVNGGAPLGPNQDETLLDVTTVMTLAPTANVVVYDAPFTGAGTFQALFNAAIDDGATVISNSWAYCEDQTTRADVESLDAIFATAAAAGISIFNGSGDAGSTCLDGSANTAAVPASAPHATAVGGSSVKSGQGKTRLSETWWDGSGDVPATGQGGFGVSRFFPRPSYQDGQTTAAMRSVPDVVSNADPAQGVMFCQASAGGCPSGALYGGTSYSTPVWAGLTALINEALGHNLGNANEMLYPLAGTPAFHDAVALASDFAHVGLGSPNVDQIVRLLAGQAIGTPDVGMSIATPVIQTAYVNGLDVPVSVPADGTTKGYIVVKLRDGNGHLVGGKTVSLVANGGSSVVIAPASGVTDVDGAIVFVVTDLTAEEVTFTATDTSDGLELTAKPKLPFVVPPAAGGGIVASLSPVTADGSAFSTITVTLRDALNRPTPGKQVTLSQGTGHSQVTAPNPSVTDVNGHIDFEVRNFANEMVMYTAVDVTDGDVPVPGSAVVMFQNGLSSPCGLTVPVGANGYTLTPFITGFPAHDFTYGNVNWGGCPGMSVAAFDPTGVFVGSFTDGAFHRVALGGGTVNTGNKLSTLGPTFAWPVFGKSGKLYALVENTGSGFFSGKVVELNPTTGAELRILASNLPCANGLAVDPLSGDLFFDNSCFGGPQDNLLRRVRSPDSVSPTVETYATLPGPANGALSFAPNGTLYVQSNYNDSSQRLVVRVSGTDTPSPGTVTTIAGLKSIFWITVAQTLPNGDVKSFVILEPTHNVLQLVDITTTPFTTTALTDSGMGSGSIGPDGCLYPVFAGTLYRLTDPNGGCTFASTTANPSITLTPAKVTPDPARGTAHTVTATLRNVSGAPNTPVFFEVTGANPRLQMVRADANGQASFTYVAAQEGHDVIVARATTGSDTTLTSNRASVTWGPGKQTTEVNLNLSHPFGNPGVLVEVVATVATVSDPTRTAVGDVVVQFTLGSALCAGTTDASGRAKCRLTPDAVGADVLTASFAGNDSLLPASDRVGFRTTDLRPLGAFTLYSARAGKRAPKLPPFGPVALADAQGSAGYDVLQPIGLATPSGVNGSGPGDPTTHLTAYAVKTAKGAPRPARRTVHTVDGCSDAQLGTIKPAHLFVPSAINLSAAVAAPSEAEHSVDHFLCSRVQGPKPAASGVGLRKGAQVDVTDQFQTRRYDLRRARLVCTPVAKSGTPAILKGSGKGSPFPISTATIRSGTAGLVCYDAKPARRRIAQTGCAPTRAGDKGTRISPSRDPSRPGVFVANQFGASQQVDTKKATLVCLPAQL